MSNNSLVRWAGIAGIVSALIMVALMFTIDMATLKPTTPLFYVLSFISIVTGLVFTLGLYQWYRAAGTLTVAATGLACLGYVLYALATPSYGSNIVLGAVADILIYIVGVALFSWLGFQTQRIPRILAGVGFVGALSGAGLYAIEFSTGNMSEALYGVYFLCSLIWLVWTGSVLLRGAGQPQVATA